MTTIELTINGMRRRVSVDNHELLLDVLRRNGFTSVREGCGVGACGACTVLVRTADRTSDDPGAREVDRQRPAAVNTGRSVSGCLARAVRYDGAEITTADGLPADDPVVQEFVAAGAMQCGYCIPGFVLMAHELLAENPAPTNEDIADHLEGNICRCGTYREIHAAVAAAANHGNGTREGKSA